MFKYIADILAQFSTPQKVIALSLILLSIVIITIGPSMIKNNDELKTEIINKTDKIKSLESELNEKDNIIRTEQKSCTNQILEREKEFIAMLDYLRGQAKNQDNKIISHMNKESLQIVDSLSPQVTHTSTVIVKNDMSNIISSIDEIKEKVRH